MTNNWTACLLQTLPPKTLDQAVARLCEMLTDDEKTVVANTPEQHLVDLHFSLGLTIRNGFTSDLQCKTASNIYRFQRQLIQFMPKNQCSNDLTWSILTLFSPIH